jgi:spore coat-associated protein N
MAKRSRKVLIPLATLAAATAVAVGSGATFTTHTHNTVSGVTAGNLKQTNSKADSALFNLSNIKPGDTVTGAVVITNSGTLQQKLTLSEGEILDGFTAGDLKLSVTDLTDSRTVYDGNFSGLGTKALLADDGTSVWAAGEAHNYRFVVTLASSAGNENQDKHAEASFSWDGVQTSATAYDQSTTVPVA